MAKEQLPSTNFDISALNEQLNDDAKNNIKLYIKGIIPGSPSALKSWKIQLVTKTKQALQALGYYQPTIIITTEYVDHDYQAIVKVAQGPSTVISQLVIEILGEANQDPEFLALIQQSSVQLNQQFNHGEYDSLKSSFSELSLTRGYFKAQWQTAKVNIDAQLNQAQIRLIFNSGQRYRFGQLMFNQPSEAQPLIDSMKTFTTDQPYHSDLLAQYNLALAQSQYFSGIAVFPNLQHLNKNIVPIQVNITEKSANSVEVGGGISSNYGLRSRIKWTKPWLNQYGHSLTSEIKLAKIERSFSASYKIPIEDPINNYATIALGWINTDNNDTLTNKYSLQLQRHTLLNSKWKRGVFLRIERESSRQGNNRLLTTNIIPGVSFARTQLKGGVNPYWGDRQALTLEFGHQGWGSDSNLAKIKFRSKWLRSVEIKHQFIANADFGAIWAKSIDNVPVSMRLFGGGDENLRAYGYNAIAPYDAEDNLIGGLYQTNLSLEYSYMFIDNWRIATFIDTGSTANHFAKSFKTDLGFGIRWTTPVGPVRIDFAFGLNKELVRDPKRDPNNLQYKRPFRVSFSIGPQL